MLRSAIIVATSFLAACGPVVEGDELEPLGEQTDALELPCLAYTQAQHIASGNWIVCGTRPFDQTTAFTFTNIAGRDVNVRLQSGPRDIVNLTVPAWPATTWWWHKYYGGFVRIEPNGSVLVSLK